MPYRQPALQFWSAIYLFFKLTLMCQGKSWGYKEEKSAAPPLKELSL